MTYSAGLGWMLLCIGLGVAPVFRATRRFLRAGTGVQGAAPREGREALGRRRVYLLVWLGLLCAVASVGAQAIQAFVDSPTILEGIAAALIVVSLGACLIGLWRL